MPQANTVSARIPREPRIDVMRGLALLMIFVDHIPDDKLNWLTLHNFGFSDAAEVFVLLAGVSAMLAYGRAFERDGAAGGLRRIAVRCGRIYLFQAALLLVTLLVVRTWTNHYHFESHIMAPMLAKPVKGLAEGLTLQALPSYLDILPLYVVLLAAFPLVYWAVRRSPWLALGLSAAVWALAGLDPHLNLPNWLDSNGWYFDPFAWQFLFTIGAVLSVLVMARGGALPYIPWLAWLCAAYLGFCFLQGAPWHDWNLPNLQLFPMAMPDKSRLSWLRILDVLALFYVVMSPPRVRAWAQSVWLRPVEACGRHSLEVFSLSCVLALFGRLIFRTYGVGIGTECLVNGVGFVLLCATGMWLDHGRVAAATTAPRPAMRRYWVPAQRH